MKRILMSAVAMVFAVGALSAQGPWFLGGGVGFNQTKLDKSKQTSFRIAPQVGYMLNENFGLALDLGYSSMKDNQGFTTNDGKVYETTVSSFGAGLTGLYKIKIADKFFFAPTLRVGADFGQEKVDVKGSKAAKTTTIGVDLNALRFEFQPSNNWGFNVGFGGIGFSNAKPKDGKATTTLGLNIAEVAAVGFTYYF